MTSSYLLIYIIWLVIVLLLRLVVWCVSVWCVYSVWMTWYVNGMVTVYDVVIYV